MQRVRWQLDLPKQVALDAPVHVRQEADRLLTRLTPELIELLAGKQAFRVEIHGKPGAKCRMHVMRFDADE
jgi:hypothetical protein